MADPLMSHIAAYTQEIDAKGRGREEAFELLLRQVAAAGRHSMSVSKSEEELVSDLKTVEADICILHVNDLAKYRIVRRVRNALLGIPIIVIATDCYQNWDGYLQSGASSVMPDDIGGTAFLAQIESLLYLKLDVAPKYVDLVWDRAAHEFRRAGKKLSLSRVETAIMELLFVRRERNVSREQLKANIWAQKEISWGNIDRAVSRLRSNIEITGCENPI